MSVALISHPDCGLHNMGATHPESPQRLSAINNQLIASGIDKQLLHFEAPLVTLEQLCRVHSREYVESILQIKPQGNELVWLDPDTAMNAYTQQAALRAAGAVVQAVDLVMGDEVKRAFCNIRPPGHHAESNQAMGFCFFNNIAVGVAHALEHWELQRVGIVDFDVHHGNGTEEMFGNDSRVFLCSSFQHPFYPFSDIKGSDHIIKMPLPAGSTGEDFRHTIQTHCLTQLKAFAPQLIMISAGFDGHWEESIAELELAEADYAWITSEIKAIADETAEGRIVSVLEGGYVLSALGRSVAAHIAAMLNKK